jgi:hypothetical protein
MTVSLDFDFLDFFLHLQNSFFPYRTRFWVLGDTQCYAWYWCDISLLILGDYVVVIWPQTFDNYFLPSKSRRIESSHPLEVSKQIALYRITDLVEYFQMCGWCGVRVERGKKRYSEYSVLLTCWVVQRIRWLFPSLDHPIIVMTNICVHICSTVSHPRYC